MINWLKRKWHRHIERVVQREDQRVLETWSYTNTGLPEPTPSRLRFWRIPKDKTPEDKVELQTRSSGVTGVGSSPYRRPEPGSEPPGWYHGRW